MPQRLLQCYLLPKVSQQPVHISKKAWHDGDTDDACFVINGAHDIHPFIRLQDKLEEYHISVGDLEIAADHGIGINDAIPHHICRMKCTCITTAYHKISPLQELWRASVATLTLL
jgi:hypothetical protein